MDINYKKNTGGHKVLGGAVVIIGFIIFVTAGYLTINLLISKEAALPCISASKEDNFEAGWQAARDIVQNLKNYPGAEGVEYLGGIIKEVKEESIIVSTDLTNPLDDANLKEREITIDNETSIILVQIRPPEEAALEEKNSKENFAATRKELNLSELGHKFLKLYERQNQEPELSEAEEREMAELRNNAVIGGIVNQFEELAYMSSSDFKHISIEGVIKDLKVGVPVYITAGKDIQLLKEFGALEIVAEEFTISTSTATFHEI